MSSKKELIRQIETLNAEVKYWKKISESHQEDARLLCMKNDIMQRKIDYLEKQLNDDKKYKDLFKHIEQQDLKITSLIKERDNWKSDCEYNEECFQAEREARYKLEDEIKVLKGEKKYPCISLECNDITGESSSLYFCFSYDERLLLADNVPKHISTDQFIIMHTPIDHKTYHVACVSPLFQGTSKLYDMARVEFEISADSKAITRSIIPTCWLSANKNKKYSLANYELNYYGVEDDKYKVFYIRDKHTGRTVPFTNFVKTNSKLSEYQLIDTFMESQDILQIQHFDGQNFNNIYIDLITFTPHQSMFSILDRRKDK